MSTQSTSARPTSSSSAGSSRARSRATPTSWSDARGRFVANAAPASRKDARDAVVAARKAFPGWSGRTAYNRGQVLYRVAEVMEDRRPQFVDAVRQGEGGTAAAAGQVVDAAIDRLVWYAGWADKLTQVVGNANPVAGPFFNLSTPEPTGVVAVLAPPGSSLLGLVSVVAPVVVTGNTAVVAASPDRPLPAVTFAEVLATSDVPGGCRQPADRAVRRTAPTLASHMDVNALDLTGLAGDAEQATALEVAAAENLKRVRRAPADEPDWTEAPGLDRMTDVLETKTVWHPIGV